MGTSRDTLTAEMSQALQDVVSKQQHDSNDQHDNNHSRPHQRLNQSARRNRFAGRVTPLSQCWGCLLDDTLWRGRYTRRFGDYDCWTWLSQDIPPIWD